MTKLLGATFALPACGLGSLCAGAEQTAPAGDWLSSH